jgi:hypothetical protein
MTKRMWIGIAALAGVMLTGAGAFAGYKFSSAPSISPTFAVGIMGSARATADSNAYIGCTLQGTTGGASSNGFCMIADAAGTSKTCSFSSASIAQAVASMTANSAVRMWFDAAGNCTQVAIDNYSWYLPITP